MSLIIPDRTLLKLQAAKPVAQKFAAAVNRNKNAWTPAQQEQLSLIYDILKETHDALVNLVEANVKN